MRNCSKCGREGTIPKDMLPITVGPGGQVYGTICWLCMRRWGFCEICGSIKKTPTASRDTQIHYDELCFK